MKKTLNAVLAVILSVAMFAGFAYVATPERTNEYQISLVSAKAVTVQDSVQGIRSYADLADAERGYQVNDVIHLAITAEVKNLEKPASNNKYKSIADKDIKVVVGSPDIDLQFARLSNPTLLTHVWSGYSVQNVATIGYVIFAGNVLEYDKATNEISWEFRGKELYSMRPATSTAVGYNLVTFDPSIDDGKIVIPAIKLKDKDATWSIGQYSFDQTYEAPEAVWYTMVLSGVTKDSETAETGSFYAKIQVSASEKFVDEAVYYYSNDGKVYSTAPANQKKWRDYVEVEVELLEIAGGYNVYRYDIPSSGVIVPIPVIYGGDHKDYKGKTDYIDGAALAWVQPQTWDFATDKTSKTTVNTAGGVTEVEAYPTYKSTKKEKVPMTSVVYTYDKIYYAPGFYGGFFSYGNGVDEEGSTELAQGLYGDNNIKTERNVKVVEKYTYTLPASVSYSMDKVYVFKADQLARNLTSVSAKSPTPFVPNIQMMGSAKDILVSPNGSSFDVVGMASEYLTSGVGGAAAVNNYDAVPRGIGKRLDNEVEYVAHFSSTTREIVVTPVGSSISNAYPLGSTSIADGNEWVVFYADINNPTPLATAFNRLNQSNKFLAPGSVYNADTSSTPQTGIVAPYILGSADTLSVAGTTYPAASSAAYTNLQNDSFAAVDRAYANFHASHTSIAGLTGAAGGGAYTTAAGVTYNSSAPAAGTYDTLSIQSQISNVLVPGLSSVKMFWPVFKEHTKDLTVKNSVAGLTVGPLFKDGTGPYATSGKAGVDADLKYKSQILEVWIASSPVIPPVGEVGTRGKVNSRLVLLGKNAHNAKDAVNGDLRAEQYDLVVDPVTGLTSLVLGEFSKYDGTNWSSISASDLVNMGYNEHDMYVRVLFNRGKTGTDVKWDLVNAAPESVWGDVQYHNGIVVYAITSNSNDRPYISIATEDVAYGSDTGYGIALFDGYNMDKFNYSDAHRIYRSNDTNLSYSQNSVGGHVSESAAMIAALRYFGLDTSFNTTFRVVDSQFTSKGAGAVYSENVTGSFKYGDLEIRGESVGASTEETEVVDEPTDDVEDTTEAVEDTTEAVEDTTEAVEDTVEDTTETVEDNSAPVAPARTGNASANVVIALAASAMVAAAGLAFVMKKRVR